MKEKILFIQTLLTVFNCAQNAERGASYTGFHTVVGYALGEVAKSADNVGLDPEIAYAEYADEITKIRLEVGSDISIGIFSNSSF